MLQQFCPHSRGRETSRYLMLSWFERPLCLLLIYLGHAPTPEGESSMLPRAPRPMHHKCGCGARLVWECRETPFGQRWLAFCKDASCGRWTTRLGDGPEPEDGL